MPNASSEAIELHTHYDIHLSLSGLNEQGIQSRPVLLRSADAVVDEFPGDPASGASEGTKGVELARRALLHCAHSGVERSSAHRSRGSADNYCCGVIRLVSPCFSSSG